MCNYEEYNGHKAEKLINLLNVKLKENWKWKTLESFKTSIVNQNQIDEFFEQEYDEIKKVIYEKIDRVMEKVFQYEKKIVQLWNEQSEF